MISAGSKLIRVIGFFGRFSIIKSLEIGKLKKAGILRAKESRYLAAVFLCNPSPSRFTLFPAHFCCETKIILRCSNELCNCMHSILVAIICYDLTRA